MSSFEDIIRAFDDVIQHKRSINNSFKIIHNYGMIIEEIDRVDNHDNITYIHSTPFRADSGLHSIPTIININ
jgi:GT2 family glycosyltransferase